MIPNSKNIKPQHVFEYLPWPIGIMSFFLIIILEGSYYYYLHFIDEEKETQDG